MSRIDADLLFVPRHAIRSHDREFFAGRKHFVLNLVDEIETPGTSMVIWGDRGIGKTSLAWQFFDILGGDRDLLRRWGVGDLKLKRAYRCFWLQCDVSMVSIEGALLRMLMPSDLGETIGDRHIRLLGDEDVIESFKREYKIDLKLLSAQFAFLSKRRKGKASEARALLDKRASIRAMFAEVLKMVTRSTKGKDLVLFLDEIGVLPDRDGIGSLIKDTNNARFVIVGIMEGPSEITGDHPSAERKLAPIDRVPGLSRDEIYSLLDRAERVYDGTLFFDRSFREAIVDKSLGFPWLVQALGHAAVRGALRERADEGEPLRLYSRHLKTPVSKLVDPKKHDKAYRRLRKVLMSEEVTKQELLQVVARSTETWMSIDTLTRLVPKRQQRFVMDNLEKLSGIGVLRVEDENVGYVDPISRLIVLLDMDARTTGSE